MKYRNKKLLSRTLAFMLASLMLVSTGLTTYASSMEGTGTLSISVGEPEDGTDEVVSVGEPEDDGIDRTEDSGDVIPTEEPADDDNSISNEAPVDETDDDDMSVEEPVTDATPTPSEEPVIIQGPDGEDYVITVEDPAADEQEPEMPSYTLTGTAGDRTVSFTSGTGFAPGTELNVTAMDAEALDAAVSGLNGTLAGKEASGVFGFTYEILGYEGDVDIVLDAGLEEGLALFDGEEYSELVYDNGFVGRPSGSVFCVALSDVEMGPVEYACEGDGFSVLAVVQPEAGISENAILYAEKLDGDARQAAFDAVKEGLELAEGTELWFEPYDVYFLDGENRIEPVDGLVQVTMSFSREPFAEIEVDKKFVAHILDSGEVEEIAMEDSGEAMTFSVGSFSIMGPAAVAYAEDDIVTPATDTEGAYAILYEDGTLVMQRGNAIHSAHGDVIGGPWTGFETDLRDDYVEAWHSARDSINAVVVMDAIHPFSTAHWFYELTNLLSADLELLDTSSVTSMHRMFYNCGSLSALSISNFDTSSVTSMVCMFFNCSSLLSLDLSSFDTSSLTDMSYMFEGCSSIEELNLDGWDTSNVISMCEMFGACRKLKSLDVSGFDTSAVTKMGGMFENCNSLESLDVSSFDTSAVTDMYRMFLNCNSLLSLDVSSFDTGAVTNMNSMFSGCGSLKSLDVSSFDTGAVSFMTYMFSGCVSLESLDVSSFDTGAVTSMDFMFSGCSALESLDVSSFDTGAVTSMVSMFSGCLSLLSLDMSGFDTSSVTSMGNMFYGCGNMQLLDISNFTFRESVKVTLMFKGCNKLYFVTAKDVRSSLMPGIIFSDCCSIIRSMDLSGWVFDESVTSFKCMFMSFSRLESLDLSGWNTSSITDMSYMFSQCCKLTDVNLSSFDTSLVTTMSQMFRDCELLKSLDLSGFSTGAVTNMSSMFEGCNSFESIDVSGFDTSSVTTMTSMFSECYQLEQLDLSGFDTSSVTRMTNMFSECHSLKSLDLSGFDTRAVTAMDYMFKSCMLLDDLDLSSFSTGFVTAMGGMFYGCASFTTIDLSGFDTGSVTTMAEMFYACENLTSLDLSNFDTSSVVNMGNMFARCRKLKALDLSDFDTACVSNMLRMFSDCTSLKSLDLSGWTFPEGVNVNVMFEFCSSLTDITAKNVHSALLPGSIFSNVKSHVEHMDLSGWTFDDSVVSLQSAFSGFSKLAELNVDGWDTSHITSMRSMFSKCLSLRNLDVSCFNTSLVLDFSYMFGDCRSLDTLDISGFDFSKTKCSNYVMFSSVALHRLYAHGCTILVKDRSKTDGKQGFFYMAQNGADGDMFMNCSAIEVIDLSGSKLVYSILRSNGSLFVRDSEPLTSYKSLFSNMPSLRELNLSGVMTDGITDMTDMFSGSPNLKKLTLDKDFHFLEGQDTGLLPNWMDVKTGTVYEDLQASYTGGDMAGTYVREDAIAYDTIYDGKRAVPGYLDRPAVLPEDPYVKGRTFLGWFTEKAGGTQLHAGDPVTQLTYYAHYQEWEYDLVLDPNGGDGERQTYHLAYNAYQKLPGAIYTYPDKVFAGWNTRKDGTGAFYSGSDTVRRLASSDGDTVTLYAQWTDPDDTVTIVFDTRGGTALQPVEVVRGADDWLNFNMHHTGKDHYTFVGWWYNPDNKTQRLNGINIGSTNTYNGMYTIYNFKIMPEYTEDKLTLYAVYLPNPVVTFDKNDGSGSRSTKEYDALPKEIWDTFTAKTTFGTLPDYADDDGNMQFIGWFTELAGGDAITSDTIVGYDDRTVYAHWGWKPVFDTAGGHIQGNFNPEYHDSSDYVLDMLPDAVRDGYTFDGWYYGDRLLHDGDTVDLTQPLAVTAHWTAKQEITVTFRFGNNLTDKRTYKGYAGEPFEMFYAHSSYPSKYISDYGNVYAEFLGWKDEDGNYRNPGDVFDKDTVLSADYAWPECILTFDPDGGSSVSGTKISSNKTAVPKGTTLWSLPGTKKTNYVLEGWYTEKDGQGEKLTIETVHEESRTYYAHWIPFYLNADDANSLYVYGAEWSNASNSNISNQGDNLDAHPSSNSSINASLHVRFELNKSIGDVVLPVGSVKIKVPGYIWKNWDGKNTGTNNISANFPQYPAVRNGMWFSYQKDGDDYVLINSKELSGSAGLDFTINYSVYPKNVPGGAVDYISKRYIDGYDFYQGQVPIQFSVDADLNGINETDVSKELSVEMHTGSRNTVSKDFVQLLYSWLPEWGPEPIDADQYFYVSWQVYQEVAAGSQDTISKNLSEGKHSGTIIKMTNDRYVYTKHLLSDLMDAGPSGLTLENTASCDFTWKSGYVEKSIASASKTFYVSKYKTGEYSKRNGYSTSTYTLSGGQETILDDDKPIKLEWYLNYSGGSNVEPVWDESAKTYSSPMRTIRIADGMPGDVMYSSGSASKPYVWEPDTGNVPLTDEDYYFKNITIYFDDYDGYFDDGGWHTGEKCTSQRPKVYVRYAGSSDYVYYSDAVYKETMTFDNNKVAGFKICHDTNSYYTNLHMSTDMYLKPTEHVKALLQDDVDIKKSSVIKNSSTCDIWTTALGEEEGLFFHVTDNTGGDTAANKNCYNLTVSNTYQYTQKSAAPQSNVIFDVERGTQDDRMYIGTWNYNNGSRKKKLNAGVFYDLLPAGTSVDPGTLKGYYTKGNEYSYSSWYKSNNLGSNYGIMDKGYYDVRFEPNWENSGRTMMILKVAVPESYNSTGISFSYMLHNTYENVIEHGTTVENDVAFVDSTENRVPPYSASGSITTITDKMYYQGLEDAYAGKITYAKANTNYIPVDAYSWGFDKSVQSISEYAHEATVLPNTSYIYRLAYSQSDYATSSKLVFYDILEGGFDGNESQWHGIFNSVNAESASSKLTDGSTSIYCQPVVYYSTKARDSFTGEDFDVTKKDVWSTVCPYDKTKVTAVAVDCSKNTDGTDFVMKGKQALEVYITMRAPKDAGNVGKTAYNEGVLWAVHGEDESPTPEYSDASTTIEDVDPEIHKSSTPESGTESRPTLVYQDDVMSYHLSVTNPSEEFTLNDIVVEDTIPTGLRADDTNLMVHFGNAENALPVMKSPRVDFHRSGQKLHLTISSLLPGETIYFDIPCDVLAKEGILENTAYITSINGIEKHFESETTWHEAQPTGMAVLKTGAFGNAVPGAKMQLLDESGEVVHEWTSTDKIYHMEVKAGTYTVHEAEAPSGHFLAEDITVVLTRQGDMLVDNEKVSPLIMDDDYTKVSVTKTDMDGNLIGGAKLAIYRPSDFEANELKDGAVPVLEWESVEGEAKELFGQLQQGEEYVLYESQAPEGLVTADPVWFTVDADGAAQTVTMVDYPEGRQVLISKKDVEGNMLPGAELTLTGPEGFEAVSWTSTDAPKLFVLPAGEYVLHETQAPTGYKLAEDVRFTVALDAEDALAVIMEDPYEAHDLSVGKTVAGNMGDKTKAFSFKLTLDKDLGTLTYVKNGETGSLEPEEDGSYLFTLAHGETITFQGIRYGTGYTVMETGSDGYTVEVSGDNASGTITEADVTVSFINTRNEGMPTGFVAFTGISGALALAAGSGWIMLAKRRKKRQGDDLEFLDDV